MSRPSGSKATITVTLTEAEARRVCQYAVRGEMMTEAGGATWKSHGGGPGYEASTRARGKILLALDVLRRAAS